MKTLPISEDDLKRTVIDMCRTLGLLVAHFRPAQIRPGVWVTPVEADGAGFPDMVIVGPGGVLFWELKSATGSASADQIRWLSALCDAGAAASVVRPRELRNGYIEGALKRLAKPRAALDQAEKETKQ
jgi:hypothetical protein